MRAIVCTEYGSAEVLQLRDVPKPTPKANEVRIKLEAAVVGPSDLAFRKGEPFIIKLIYGLRKPRINILGTEFAGVVDEIGKDVQSFKVGDRVCGLSANTFGAHAEYMCLPEKDPMVIQSPHMSHQEAVAICDGALTSLIFLRDVAKLQPGQKVLINGASGALGTSGVQLAKYFGAEVTGVCSSKNMELVRSLGADHVLDYTRSDFTQGKERYDVVYDAVGKSSFSRCKPVLTPTGAYMTTVPSLDIVFQILRSAFGKGKKAKFTTAGLKQNKANLNFLKERFDAGELKAVIDRCYPLEDIAEAYDLVETERKRGNVVITF